MVRVKLTGYVRYRRKRYPPGDALVVSEDIARQIVKAGAGLVEEIEETPTPDPTAEEDLDPGVVPDSVSDPTDEPPAAAKYPSLSELTVKELRGLAAKRGIDASSRMRKAELIKALGNE